MPFASSLTCVLLVGSTTPTPPSSADSGLGRRKKSKRKKPRGYITQSGVHPSAPRHDFPKAKPLPAVGEAFDKSGNGKAERTDSSR